MERTRIREQHDENALDGSVIPGKKVLATSAAATAVKGGAGGTRKRAALQTLTNINHPRSNDISGLAKKAAAASSKISIYTEHQQQAQPQKSSNIPDTKRKNPLQRHNQSNSVNNPNNISNNNTVRPRVTRNTGTTTNKKIATATNTTRSLRSTTINTNNNTTNTLNTSHASQHYQPSLTTEDSDDTVEEDEDDEDGEVVEQEDEMEFDNEEIMKPLARSRVQIIEYLDLEDDEDDDEGQEEGGEVFNDEDEEHEHGDVQKEDDRMEDSIRRINNDLDVDVEIEQQPQEIDDDDEDENNYNGDALLHDLTEPTALSLMNVYNDFYSEMNPDALFPVWEQVDKEELRQAYYEIRNRPGILDDQDEDTYDISMVVEYGDDIFAYMRQLEVKMRPNPGYMDAQTEVNWSMRGILVDWLVQVHHRFNLLPETLFLTVNYIDRFLSIKTVSLSKFQLVGAVALFLAAKYEEINCPSVQEIVYMVDHGYTIDEILKAERYMIDLLDFNLGWPGPMSFLRRTSKADDYDLETRTLAKYLLEISIMDERFVGALPSWIAGAAHCLSREMLNRGEWTTAHVYFSGYTKPQLVPALNALLQCCEKPEEHHKAIYEKYSDRKFKKASLFVADYMRRRREGQINEHQRQRQPQPQQQQSLPSSQAVNS